MFLPTRPTPYICDFGTLGISNIIQKDSNLYECPLPIGYKEKVLTPSIDISVSLRDAVTNLQFISVDRSIQFYNCSKIGRLVVFLNLNCCLFVCLFVCCCLFV